MTDENNTPETNEDFNKEIKIYPFEKIKKGLAIGLIFFLLIVIVFSFFNATNKPVIPTKAKIEEVQPTENLSNKKIDSEEFGLKTSYENESIEKNEFAQRDIVPKIDTFDRQDYYENQQIVDSLEDNYRISYKEKRFEEELRSRVSNITF